MFDLSLSSGRSSRIRVAVLGIGLLAVPEALAQQCYIETSYQCGPGTLCGVDGTCQPISSIIQGTTYWVDQATGKDTNEGSEFRPWKTINRAAQGVELKPGDGVLVRAGTYYEEIVPRRGGTTGAPITYAAYPGEEVIVSGAEPLVGTWTKSGNIWSMKWPYTNWMEGNLDRLVYNRNGVLKYDAARHREMVIAGGNVLAPFYNNVTTWQPSFTPTTLPEGTFFVKGTGSLATGTLGKPETVYVRLPGDANPNQVKMETSRKNHLFNASGHEECSSDVPGTGALPHSHLRVTGFIFKHVANVHKQGAVCTGFEGTLIDNIVVEWTNGTGLLMFGKNHVVRGVRAYYNGIDGFKGGVNETLGCDHCTTAHSISKYNNWKGYDPYHESGGGKWTYTTNSLFTQLDFSENEGPGLWLDTENDGNTIERSRFHANMGVNLFIEVHSDDNVARNIVSTMAVTAQPAVGDKWYDKWSGVVGNRFIGHGMIIDVSIDNVAVHNTFMGNAASGLRIGSDERGDGMNNSFYNNLFVDNVRGKASAELAYEKYVEVAPALTNKGGGNAYWPHNSSEYATFHFVPKGGATIDGFETNSLPAWRTWSKTDQTSLVLATAQPHVRDRNDEVSGWMLAEGSQAAGKAPALPAGIAPVTEDFHGNTRPASGAAIGAHEGASPYVEVPVLAGHNLVGLPLDVPSPAVSAVFPQATSGSMLAYDGADFFTPNPADLVPGAAYWLHFPADGTHRVSGLPVASRTWVLREGWNLVSGPTCAISLSQIDDPNGIVHQDLVFGYERAFVVPENGLLQPGKGYWVFADPAGTATLTCGSASKQAAKPPLRVASLPLESGRLVFRSAGGVEQALRWGSGLEVGWALPPAVAMAELDVRFASDRSANHTLLDAPIALNAKGSTTLTLLGEAGPDALVLDVFDGRGDRMASYSIQAGAPILLAGEGPRRLVVRKADDGAAPLSFALEANYPNPFRDHTTIRFALPEASRVSLRLVDLLGREIRRIVDGERPAGWHAVDLAADGLSSGVYLIEIEAGTFRARRSTVVVH
jgi:hypothetical protein